MSQNDATLPHEDSDFWYSRPGTTQMYVIENALATLIYKKGKDDEDLIGLYKIIRGDIITDLDQLLKTYDYHQLSCKYLTEVLSLTTNSESNDEDEELAYHISSVLANVKHWGKLADQTCTPAFNPPTKTPVVHGTLTPIPKATLAQSVPVETVMRNSDQKVYKASFVNINFQNRKIITLMRTNGFLVEILRAAVEEGNSYDHVIKTLILSCSENLDVYDKHDPTSDTLIIGESLHADPAFIGQASYHWSAKHCPPLYLHRRDLYNDVDVENPIFGDMMSKITHKFADYPTIIKHYFLNREIIVQNLPNIPSIIIEDLSNDEIQWVDEVFANAYNPKN